MNRALTAAGRTLLLALPLLLVACVTHPPRNPTLDELRRAVAAEEVQQAGDWMMDRPVGNNRLDDRQTAAPLVAVHGFGSKGKEWVEPLATLDAAGTTWFRWNWMTCPDTGATKLAAAIAEVAARPGVERIRVVGHSYGGLISALVAHRYAGPVPLEVHVVAAPLAGMPRMKTLCGALDPGAAGAGEAPITQWRTVHRQDGAFRDLAVDPQVVEWAGDDVVALPAEWNGGRLGHNRSVQWVAEELKRRWSDSGAGQRASGAGEKASDVGKTASDAAPEQGRPASGDREDTPGRGAVDGRRQ